MITTAAFRDAGQTATTGRRHTADERRAQVPEAAIHEFALHGLHQATVAAIGARAKISQPYVFALFRDKKTLFLVAQDRVREDIMAALTAAWRTATPGEPPALTLQRSYRLLANPDTPRCQFQGYAAAAATPEIREHMRRGYQEIFDRIQRLTGADETSVARITAMSLLLNLATMLALPGLDRQIGQISRSGCPPTVRRPA